MSRPRASRRLQGIGTLRWVMACRWRDEDALIGITERGTIGLAANGRTNDMTMADSALVQVEIQRATVKLRLPSAVESVEFPDEAAARAAAEELLEAHRSGITAGRGPIQRTRADPPPRRQPLRPFGSALGVVALLVAAIGVIAAVVLMTHTNNVGAHDLTGAGVTLLISVLIQALLLAVVGMIAVGVADVQDDVEAIRRQIADGPGRNEEDG